MAWMPQVASPMAAMPPELASLIVPVSGLFAPAESRPEHGAPVPVRVPGAKTNLFAAESGWQVAGTSSAIDGRCVCPPAHFPPAVVGLFPPHRKVGHVNPVDNGHEWAPSGVSKAESASKVSGE